jgi:hypothetical protein
VLQKQLADIQDTAAHIRIKDMTVLCANTLGGDRYLYNTSPLEALLQRAYDEFTAVALREIER